MFFISLKTPICFQSYPDTLLFEKNWMGKDDLAFGTKAT